MNERLRKVLVYATLPLAITWAAFTYVDRDNTAVIPAVGETATVEIPTPVGPPPAAELARKEALPWGSDPFRCDLANGRPVTSEGGLAWALSGIVYSNQYPLAFINGRSVAVGDTIMGASVVAINPGTVILELNGERLQLRINKG